MGTNRRHHFGSVRRLNSGRWQARYLDATGRRHTAGTFATEKDARHELAKIEVGIARGEWIDPDAGEVKFEKFIRDYMETRSVEWQPTTLSGYQSSLKHLLPAFGNVRLKAITPLLVEQWWTRHARTGTGAQVRRNAYSLLSGSMRAAVRWGLIGSSPCNVERGFKDGSKPRPHLSPEQFARLVAYAPERFRVILWTMFGAHLRLGELCGLNAGDFDPKTGRLTVERQAIPSKGGVELRPTKTGAIKTVQVLEPALSMLRDYVASRPAHPKAPMFTGPMGGRITRSAVRLAWNNARERAGLPWAHLHDSRHTGLTVIAAHASLAETMARGGHTSAAAALRYQHAASERDSEVASAAGLQLVSLASIAV
jgi:integrase